MALEPGQLVSPQVRLQRKLTSGGMGSLWVADQLKLRTQVAVKFIQGNHADNPELTTRFAREATTAARIKSPHVVHIHDHGVTDAGEPYMVMELLEGEDLSARLEREGPMQLVDVARIVRQVALVLGKAHPLSIVHRDIKPSNIFLVGGDEGDIFVKLLDFGVAKITDGERSDRTNTGVMMGTMVYMSPEQLLDARNVDHRADLWSLAVVAFYAITGKLPFSDENGIGSLVLALDRGRFERASSLRADLPASIDAWFAKAFTRKPDERFVSAKEMADELIAAIGSPDLLGLTTSASNLPRVPLETLPEILPPPLVAPPEHSEPPRDPAKTRRFALAGALVGVFIVAVAVGVRSMPTSHPGRAEPTPSQSAPLASAAHVDSAAPAPSSEQASPDPSDSASAAVSASAAPPTATPRFVPSGRLPGARTPAVEKDYGF